MSIPELKIEYKVRAKVDQVAIDAGRLQPAGVKLATMT